MPYTCNVNPLPWCGVGLRIALPTIGYCLLVGVMSYMYPDALTEKRLAGITTPTGAGILFIGSFLYMLVLLRLRPAYRRCELVRNGIFARTRHPIYAIWIFLILPGIVLQFDLWPLFASPLIAYIAFKMSIHREENALERQFGATYRNYKARVNELLPSWKARTIEPMDE